jgi:energy-coupling factor transporter ATP-binding protein EcfA2
VPTPSGVQRRPFALVSHQAAVARAQVWRVHNATLGHNGRMGSLLVVTGPPGAGKSTLAEALALKMDPSVLVAGGALFRFLRNGAIDPWLPQANDQHTVVTNAGGAVAGRFARGGGCIPCTTASSVGGSSTSSWPRLVLRPWTMSCYSLLPTSAWSAYSPARTTDSTTRRRHGTCTISSHVGQPQIDTSSHMSSTHSTRFRRTSLTPTTVATSHTRRRGALHATDRHVRRANAGNEPSLAANIRDDVERRWAPPDRRPHTAKVPRPPCSTDRSPARVRGMFIQVVRRRGSGRDVCRVRSRIVSAVARGVHLRANRTASLTADAVLKSE